MSPKAPFGSLVADPHELLELPVIHDIPEGMTGAGHHRLELVGNSAGQLQD